MPVLSFAASKDRCDGDEIYLRQCLNRSRYLWVGILEMENSSTDLDGVHTYGTASTYDVKLVGDKQGCKDSLTRALEIYALPDASFNATADMATVDLSPIESGAKSYEWDFGDGNTSTDENATHTYDIEDSKNMTVTLTIINDNDCEGTSSQDVFIVGTGIDELLPKGVMTLNTYPNPFNTHTRIELSLNKAVNLQVSLYDINGKELAVLFNGDIDGDKAQIDVESQALGLRPGTYLARIVVDGEHTLRQIIEMR